MPAVTRRNERYMGNLRWTPAAGLLLLAVLLPFLGLSFFRFDARGDSAILRLEGQWADRELIPMEKFELGGANSVRGYRENQIISDSGFFASIDVKVDSIATLEAADDLLA